MRAYETDWGFNMNFREVITSSVLADYLTAEFGHDLAVWEDGITEIIESALYWKQCGPVARVKCPGIGNLDSTVFSDQYAMRTESGQYIEIETGRVIGYLADLIRETCQDGDVTEFMDELIEKLQESKE